MDKQINVNKIKNVNKKAVTLKAYSYIKKFQNEQSFINTYSINELSALLNNKKERKSSRLDADDLQIFFVNSEKYTLMIDVRLKGVLSNRSYGIEHILHI